VGYIGGEPLDVESGEIASFSVIGIPGTPQGQAVQNDSYDISLTPNDPAIAGDIRGRLQPDSYLALSFGWPDYIPFDLAASGNEIQLGACDETSPVCTTAPADLPSGQSGFAVLALNAASLQPVDPEMVTGLFATNTGDPVTDATNVQDMANFIDFYDGDPMIFLITSIGTPQVESETVGAWNALSEALNGIGANTDLFNTSATPSGPGGYAFVGGPGLQGDDLSPVAGQPFDPEGLLSRRTDSRLEVQSADPLGVFTYEVMPLAYQAPKEWPLENESWYDEAQAWFAEPDQLDLEALPDIRDNYWSNLDAPWSKIYGWLAPGSTQIDCDEAPVMATECGQLQAQLYTEVGYLLNLQLMQSNLEIPFLTAPAAEQVDLGCIATDIQNTVNVDGDSGGEVLWAFEEMLGILSSLAGAGDSPGPQPRPQAVRARDERGRSAASSCQTTSPAAVPGEAVEDLADAGLGVLSGVFGLTAVFATDTDGTKLMEELETEASALNVQYANAQEAGIATLQNVVGLLASDWGKLSYIGPLLPANPEWTWSNDSLDFAFSGLTTSARQNDYEQLMPVNLWNMNWGPLANIDDFDDHSCPSMNNLKAQLAGDEPPSAQYQSTVGFASGSVSTPQPTTNLYALATQDPTLHAPESSLTDALFQTPSLSASSAGFTQSQFFNQTMPVQDLCF
jgi:hypothetical protein